MSQDLSARTKARQADAQQRVARGAAYLDDVHPEWAHEIDLRTLDLSNCLGCILGQLSGSFEAGVRRYVGTYDDARDFGFERALRFDGLSVTAIERANAAAYEALQNAWIEQIAQRVTQPTPTVGKAITEGVSS
jgi:hypothetical protein